MTDEVALDELGPVDYLVVEFPAGASNFTGEMAAELVALVDAGTIRVIDVLILTKDEDGTVDAMELSDLDELGELAGARGRAGRAARRGRRRAPRRGDGAWQHGRRPDLGEPVGSAVRVGRPPGRRPAHRRTGASRSKRSSPRSRPTKH